MIISKIDGCMTTHKNVEWGKTSKECVRVLVISFRTFVRSNRVGDWIN